MIHKKNTFQPGDHVLVRMVVQKRRKIDDLVDECVVLRPVTPITAAPAYAWAEDVTLDPWSDQR